MINIKDKTQCCGCNACGDICPKNAISYKADEEGFLYPIIEKDICIDCGLCDIVCPILQSDKLKSNTYKEPICYAVQCKNLESLFNSTSGGAFATLAEKMYKIGGYVGGAIFNDDYSVTQFISNNKDDLEKLRNSKYAQSNSEGFYISVRDLLILGEKVLVCGLPCQMAALRAFLQKDYDNLIIIDLICLGINSPKVLIAYLNYLEQKYSSKIVYYKAKNKEFGWRELTTKVVFKNGQVLYDKKDTNYFTNGFVATHVFARPSCYECRFKGTPRIADITIGDLWGAESIVGKEYDNDLGTSVVMLNTMKGLDFFELVKPSIKNIQVNYSEVLKGNSALEIPITKPIFNREKLYQDFNSMTFEAFSKKYINIPSQIPLNIKSKVKNLSLFLFYVLRASRGNILNILKNIYYNLLCCKVETNILKGKFIVINKKCVIQFAKNSKIEIGGIFQFGVKRVLGSKLESRLLVESSASLKTGSGSVYYGADIEVFSGARLTIGDGIIFNINACIICGDEITIGENVCFGRNVTVRDNNGGHFISRRIYKDKRPVSIGQHSWICEQAIVMPGSKIGVGVIVGARSMVSGKISNFTLVSGAPTKVVDENIFWKQ